MTCAFISGVAASWVYLLWAKRYMLLGRRALVVATAICFLIAQIVQYPLSLLGVWGVWLWASWRPRRWSSLCQATRR